MTKAAYLHRQIPLLARALVRQRETQRCARCHGAGREWHHRRSRRVVILHRHCPCNGVWLCHDCHTWVHSHPTDATRHGFVLTQHEPEPFRVPVWTTWGWRYHTCSGAIEWIDSPPVDAEATQLRKEPA